MKPTEFTQLLKDAELSQAKFARIAGYKRRQANKWASGEVEIPQAIALLITLLAFIHKIRKAGENVRRKKN